MLDKAAMVIERLVVHEVAKNKSTERNSEPAAEKKGETLLSENGISLYNSPFSG